MGPIPGMNPETTMPHGAPAGAAKPAATIVGDHVLEACRGCCEVIAAAAARRPEFRQMDPLQRNLLADSFEQVGKCAYHLAAKLREGK